MATRLRTLAALVWLALMPAVAGAAEGPAAATAPWWNGATDWAYRKPLTIDTGATGVNLAGSVGRVPLLVRLHGGNFTFAEAADTGADLRFIDSDGKTPLAYHIENWDPQAQLANIWVDAPSIAGGQKKTIYMYYGKKDAPVGINTPGTFDPDYTLVYHFEEAAGQPVTDETSYKNASVGVPAGVVTGGAVGRAARFQGTGLQVQPTPALEVAAGAPLSVSAWVRQDAATPDAAILARRGAGGGLVVGLAAAVPYVELGAARITANAAIPAGRFVHIGVSADGSAVKLYVNGVLAGEGPAATPALTAPIAIGGDPTAPFTGLIDELRISKIARAPGIFAFDAGGQAAETRLTSFGVSEEPGAGGGVLGYVFQHISDLDLGIIALCLLLLAAAIAVMIWKGGYLGRVASANALFLKRYRRMTGDLESLETMELTAAERAAFPQSPLARIYQSGIDEVEERRRLYGSRPLSGETVEAIRSELDAQQTVENQKFDKLMVLLTIAISGGPFIGLLGTVIGVMTVFGGVAMAGDVNVNAIAPGIAAALMATIAGLAAAIPSLFGYNYLNSRITVISDEMRVFVDRLVTRLAETAAHKASPPPLAMAAE